MPKRVKTIFLGVILLVGLAAGTLVLAQSSANYDLSWNVFGGGGGRSTSANYIVDGTIGQQVVGQSVSSSYGLSSGFWFGDSGVRLYLPTIAKP